MALILTVGSDRRVRRATNGINQRTAVSALLLCNHHGIYIYSKYIYIYHICKLFACMWAFTKEKCVQMALEGIVCAFIWMYVHIWVHLYLKILSRIYELFSFFYKYYATISYKSKTCFWRWSVANQKCLNFIYKYIILFIFFL